MGERVSRLLRLFRGHSGDDRAVIRVKKQPSGALFIRDLVDVDMRIDEGH
jgi:hypothetical protein